MNARTLLDQLCERYHIAREYRDVWGNLHSTAPTTQLALLAAMGVPTENEAVMQDALSQADAADWRRPLPPVQVVGESAEVMQVMLSISAQEANLRFRWEMVLEDGQRSSGEFFPVELELRGEQMVQGQAWQHRVLELPGVSAIGYHRLGLRILDVGGLEESNNAAAMSLIVVPHRCYQPEALQNEGRVWGPAIQLYAVRSARNWGIGDFTDLIRLLEFSVQSGAALVGVNPLHSLFPHEPANASPYSPSSRLFLNGLYIDVEAVPDFSESVDARQRVGEESFQARLRALRASEFVDYVGVSKAKTAILEMLYRQFRRQHLDAGSERAGAFRRFQAEQGEALRQHALCEALQAWLHEQDEGIWGWPAWPESYRRPQSETVAAFAAEHGERIEFFEYLQWQAHEQLHAAGRRSQQLGLGVGIYQDLAVGVDIGGTETWSNQSLYAISARIGSPPDYFSLNGQDWGITPWHPERLREQAYAPFIATLRHNMRFAGALRIDHVMALMRLYWVPVAASPREGSYVSYPFSDLLGILALESQRSRCMVIGEDLGTVPDELRQALHPMGVLAYRVLYFEKAPNGDFTAPRDFAPQALVAITTHDLPTIRGYWRGADLELREQLGLFPNAELRAQQVIARAQDRARLLVALENEELLPEGMSVQLAAVPEMTQPLAVAIHRYLARSPAKVMAVQLEDMLGQAEQVNLPGTTDQYPNWRRKLDLDIELWSEDSRVMTFVNVLREERGSVKNAAQSPPPAPSALQRPIIPRSTYRLQLRRDFTFDDAAEVVPYLRELGISHCYTSSCLQSRPGSTHGYDIVDHSKLNAELGGEAGFAKLTNALREHDMALLLDIVPNHMGVMGRDNAWWLDVLENGPASSYASFFDIDWNPLKETLRGKVLLPVLGDHYGSVLDRRELVLTLDADRGAFAVTYYEHAFPIDPREYPRILARDTGLLEASMGSEDPRLLEFQSLITAFGHLPLRSDTSAEHSAERARDKEVLKAGLARLYRDADIARFVDETLELFNRNEGVELLHELLENQAWRLAYWRVASDEINYRRFFDINELAGLRTESPDVFEATHGYILELIAQGKVQGLRIDHPDGLYDPATYFRRLQARAAAPGSSAVPEKRSSAIMAPTDAAIGAPAGEKDKPLYLIVEKILASHERLRPDWAVHGTTGYDFTSLVNGLFVHAASEAKMDRIYREFIGGGAGPDDMLYSCKKLVIRTSMASELHVLTQQLSRIAEIDRHTRDFTLSSLRDALSEVVASFPVYRTYVRNEGCSDDDRHYVDWAVNVARKRNPAADPSVFDFVREVLVADIAEGKSADYRQRVIAFAMKFQQYTGPVMAKGLEDTGFYRYNRLMSLNEVGGEAKRFGISVAGFHLRNQERAKNWPHTMLSSSTHDSKRNEDVRVRIDGLSEAPAQWRAKVRRWTRINRSKKQLLDDRPVPSSNDEYLLYQTLVGAWPLDEMDKSSFAEFRERIKSYMLKAVKEAKQHTSWINPEPEYEKAVAGFVDGLLDDAPKNPFLADFLPFQRTISRAGLFNSLSQTLLKLTAPGVPDTYQGNELWDFSLVDPDNRRPVDYDRRRARLADLQSGLASGGVMSDLAAGLVGNLSDGRAKLYLIWRTLWLRREHPELFREGDYLPLPASGSRAAHLCAFARRHGERVAVIVVPRLIIRLAAKACVSIDEMWGEAILGGEAGANHIWGETWLEVPIANWENWLTGERLQGEAFESSWRLPAGRLLQRFPVAILLGAFGPDDGS